MEGDGVHTAFVICGICYMPRRDCVKERGGGPAFRECGSVREKNESRTKHKVVEPSTKPSKGPQHARRFSPRPPESHATCRRRSNRLFFFSAKCFINDPNMSGAGVFLRHRDSIRATMESTLRFLFSRPSTDDVISQECVRLPSAVAGYYRRLLFMILNK